MSKITEFAHDKECTIRIPGSCNHRRETSVWCHLGGSAAGKGIGMKAPYILGAIGCSSCHDIVDHRVPRPVGLTRNDVKLMHYEGHARSVCLLLEARII